MKKTETPKKFKIIIIKKFKGVGAICKKFSFLGVLRISEYTSSLRHYLVSRFMKGERLRLIVFVPNHLSFTEMIGFDHFLFTDLRVGFVSEDKNARSVP